jgi:hypothetical protein
VRGTPHRRLGNGVWSCLHRTGRFPVTLGGARLAAAAVKSGDTGGPLENELTPCAEGEGADMPSTKTGSGKQTREATRGTRVFLLLLLLSATLLALRWHNMQSHRGALNPYLRTGALAEMGPGLSNGSTAAPQEDLPPPPTSSYSIGTTGKVSCRPGQVSAPILRTFADFSHRECARLCARTAGCKSFDLSSTPQLDACRVSAQVLSAARKEPGGDRRHVCGATT